MGNTCLLSMSLNFQVHQRMPTSVDLTLSLSKPFLPFSYPMFAI